MERKGEEVKILGIWGSPFCCRVEIALKIKGIQYQYIQQDLQNKSNTLLNSNPIHHKVPVLVHNGKSIPESLIILEYIEDTWPQNPIFPKDPHARASTRFCIQFVEQKLMQTVYKTGEAKREEIEQFTRIGSLDIVMVVLAHWFKVVREQVFNVEFITADKFPELHKWMAKVGQFDCVKECLPPSHELAAFIKSRIQSA